MLYYKVKKDFYCSNNPGMYRQQYAFIENELLTISELNRLFREDYLEKIIDKKFTVVNINKNNTYTMFGCRFENKKGGD